MQLASLLILAATAAVAERRSYTAYTQPITLDQGGVSNAFHTLKIPPGPIAVYRFAGDIVEIDANGVVTPTPTYDAYLHHHVVGSKHERYKEEAGKWTPMKPKGVYHGVGFGAGTETRGTPQEFYHPFAFFTAEDEHEWIANVHIINMRGLAPAKAHRCLECPCTAEDVFANNTINGVENPMQCNAQLLYDRNTVCSFETYHGGLWCCNTGEHCLELDELASPAPANSTYYMRYTIEYDDIVPENREVYLAGCCDASGNLTHHGAVEYDIPACDPVTHPGCVYTVSTRQHLGTGGSIFELGQDYHPIDKEIELVFAVGHQHRAGLGIHLYNDTTDELLCSSVPTYGTGTEAGNEDGYVISMSSCTFDPPRRMRSSDIVRIVASYDNTVAHTGVMSLWYLAVADVVEGETVVAAGLAGAPGTSPVAYVAIAVVAAAVLAAAVYARRATRQGYESVENTTPPTPMVQAGV